jgi:hypothetical protein
MLKKIVQVSSLSLMVAFAAVLPAAAGEEDAAAPVGSFTSDMAIPASQFGPQFGSHERFAMHRHGGFWFGAHRAHMRGE